MDTEDDERGTGSEEREAMSEERGANSLGYLKT